MTKLVLGVDIDNTVVDSNQYWYDWLVEKTGVNPGRQVYYDQSIQFRKYISKHDALEFWRSEHVYDNMVPMQDAARTLFQLKQDGHTIVFISTLKGNHHKSKVEFMKKYFWFYDAFLGTKEKEYVKIDAMIDDNFHVLNQFKNTSVGQIYFHRGYIDHRQDFYKSYVQFVWNWDYAKMKDAIDRCLIGT